MIALRPVHIFALIIVGAGSIFLTIGLAFLISNAPEQETARGAALAVVDGRTWKNATSGSSSRRFGLLALGAFIAWRGSRKAS